MKKKRTILNWIGVSILTLGIISFSVDTKMNYKYITALLCLSGVVQFITGFYLKKQP